MQRELSQSKRACWPRQTSVMALCVSALNACGADHTTVAGTAGSPAAGQQAAQEDSRISPNGENTEPLYVIHSTIDTAETRTGYLATTASIEGDVEVDVTRGIEIPGGGYLYSPPDARFFLIGGSEEPTFTRYELTPDGNLEQRGTVSFAPLGVQFTYRHVIFIDDQKAYFLDESQLQIIAFNPTTMEIYRSVAVDDFQCAEAETSFGTPIRRDDGFYFTRGCWDLDITSSGASLVHLDPVTDQVTVMHDPRCMGMQVGFLADSGDAYWFSDHDASVEWTYQRRDAPHDCALRLRAGDTTFDRDWELDLTTRTGGVSAVAAVPATGSSIWVRVFEPAAFIGEIPVQEIDWGLEAWRWGLLDVESDAPVELNRDSRLVVSYGSPINVDGRSFSPVSNSDYSETTLIELTSAGVVERIRVQGELRKVVRLR